MTIIVNQALCNVAMIGRPITLITHYGMEQVALTIIVVMTPPNPGSNMN